VRCDVRDPEDVAILVETTVERLGGIDILVNNAAIETDTAPQEVDLVTWDSVIETNFRAYWLTAKHAYASLSASDHAAVVNVSSNHAFLTHPGKFPYNALKASINGMTRALSVDWGVDGIRVNAVAPGWTAVERIEAEVDEAERHYLERIHPLGRLGTPDDVALATLFLASDMASFVTGETLLVDGGRSQIMQDDIYLREALSWPGYGTFDE
jgi:NAD(P)-dependent dehydrogenase (short-subunit alcohol dehydrogenase family)